MIVFLVQQPHTYTHAVLTRRRSGPRIQCRSYDWLLRCKRVPPASYIFTDRERMDYWDLRVLADMYAHLARAGPGYRVFNDPALMKNRQALLRALHEQGINSFNTYAVTECKRPARFPVFIRRGFDHRSPLTGLLDDVVELDAALARLRAQREPEEGLLITEYCAQPVADELFRKLAAFRIGDRILFHNTVHENSWLVKYGTLNAASQTLYDDEYRMIQDNAFADRVRQAFEVAGVEYGRADFGLVDGQPQFYEINTNPHVRAPRDHPNPVRNQSQTLAWEKYWAALAELDTDGQRARRAPRFRSAGLGKTARIRLSPSRPPILR